LVKLKLKPKLGRKKTTSEPSIPSGETGTSEEPELVHLVGAEAETSFRPDDGEDTSKDISPLLPDEITGDDDLDISLPVREDSEESTDDNAVVDDLSLDEDLIDVIEKKEKPSKKKKLSLGLKKKKKSGKSKESAENIEKQDTFSEENEISDGKSSKKKSKDKSKKKSKFCLKMGKKKTNTDEIIDDASILSDYEQEGELEKESRLSPLLKKIEQLITPAPETIEEIEFVVGELSIPAPGVTQKEVNITYEVTPETQYVHIEFDGESLLYRCLEPPMSETEQETLRIIENAFDKMAHSEILLVEEEDRPAALRDRFELILDIYRLKISDTQKDKFFYYLHKKYMGFDRMDILMKDPYLEDVTCNGPFTPLYVNHRVYGSIATDVIYGEIELNNFVMRMAQAAGRHISVLEPIRDATLVDGSRANLTLGKEVTKRGSTFTIRRFKSNPVSCIDLMNYKTYDSTVLAYFWLMIEYKRSVLAAGGTASGKTTTLNALGAFIPPEYKIVSIEDTAEMNLMHPNWTQSITRAGFGGSDGGKAAGDIELFDLLKAALRQRPEYIVVGEVRGAEAGTLFQAISVGHPCMGTIHAGSIHELLSRVESEPMNVPRNLFASVDMVIFNSMIKVGEHFLRRALRIVEVVELDPERGDLITNPVFKWNPVTDEYEFSGSSALFDAINDEFGIEQEELIREMDVRGKYLEGLANDGITEYEEVAKAIRKYSRQKDELMESVH